MLIHRWLLLVETFDAMFVAALAWAALQYGGPSWLVFIIYPMLLSAIFTMIQAVLTYSAETSKQIRSVGSEINFLARCVRDRTVS
jgi:hypothetical protein